MDAPALVDEETWEVCQERLAGNRERLSGSSERKHMLSGLLRCPACGRNMIGHRQIRIEPRKRKEAYVRHVHYYHCPDGRSLKIVGVHSCSRKQYKASVLEGLVQRSVEELASTPEFMERALEDCRRLKSAGFSEAEYEKVAAQVRALDGKEDAAVRAQIAGIENGTNPAIYTNVLKEIADKRISLRDQLGQMEERRSQAGLISPREDAAAIQSVMADVREALYAPELTPAEKHALIARVIDDIVPQEAGCRITLRKPFKSSRSVTHMSASSPSGCNGCAGV